MQYLDCMMALTTAIKGLAAPAVSGSTQLPIFSCTGRALPYMDVSVWVLQGSRRTSSIRFQAFEAKTTAEP